MTTTAADSPQTDSPARLNPAALSVDELARLLSAAGSRLVTPEQIQADIDAGAPGRNWNDATALVINVT